MTWGKLKEFFQELIYFVLDRTPDDWQEIGPLDPEKPTVVLISGFTATRRSLSVMRRRLIKDGFNVRVFSLDWRMKTGGVISGGLVGISEKFFELMSGLLEEMRGDRNRVFIVAHSAGGLVARYFIQRMGGGYYCSLLVTLATPHHGSWVSLFGFFTPLITHVRCLLQLLPISKFIRNINRFPLPRGLHIVSIYSMRDLVCPPRSTRLPRNWRDSDWIETVEVKDITHNDFLLQKQTYELLLKYIKEQIRPASLKDLLNG